MNTEKDFTRIILVVEDIEEVRDGLEKLLKAEGYQVEPARSVEDAIARAILQPPHLILICLPGTKDQVVEAAISIRQKARLKEEEVPVVIFGSDAVPQGGEVAIGNNIYLSEPDNFNQLRAFLHRLLSELPFLS